MTSAQIGADPTADDDVAAHDRGVFAAVREVLCDADGNLFPSEEPAFVASVQVTNDFLAGRGVDRRYGAEELRIAATGMSYRTTLVTLALEHGIPVAAELTRAAGGPGPLRSPTGAAMLTAGEVDDWVEREKHAVTDYLRTALQPDLDVLEPLAALAEDYGVAAVSSSADSRIAACFEVTGMAQYFPADRRFSAEDSLPRPTSKPDPAIYLHAGRALGISGPEGVAIEDSVAGATAAVAAGFPTIGNLQFVQPAERAERRTALEAVGVAAIVTSWTQVVELLRRDPS